jgi:putative CocE/NonD family hydrolase
VGPITRSSILIERNVEATMRDGTILRADVYRPDSSDELPVLLQRTPYGKDMMPVNFAMLSAERGYAVVIQDTRGRWASDGEHYPMRDEFEDGYDAVEWAASQPWANGKVGMWGLSYLGWTQWAAAATRPPSLVAIFPTMANMDGYALWRPGGALALGFAVSWALFAGVGLDIPRMELSPEERVHLMEELAEAMDGMTAGTTFRTLPLTEIPVIKGLRPLRFCQDLLAHDARDAFWDRLDARARNGQVAVPAYHMSGWYDLCCSTTLASYVHVRDGADNEFARRSQKLIMGPWSHGTPEGLVGDVDFGVRASELYVLSFQIMWR